MKIMYKEKEYELATNLRVAYEVQGEFEHKAYMEIFSGMNADKLENQVKILYVAFRIKNPGVASYKEFFNDVVDTWALRNIILVLNNLVEAITYNGMSEEEIEQIKNPEKK